MPLLPLRKVVPDTDALADDINQIIDALQDVTAGHDHNGANYFGKPVDHDWLVHKGTYLHDRVGSKGYSLDQIADFVRGLGVVDGTYNPRVLDGSYKIKTGTIQLTECWKFSRDDGTSGLHSDFQKVVTPGFSSVIAVQAYPLYNAPQLTVRTEPLDPPGGLLMPITYPNNSYSAAPQPNYWDKITILSGTVAGLAAGQFCIRISGWSGWLHGWSVGDDPCHTDGWNHHLIAGQPDSALSTYAPWVTYIAVGT